MAYRPNTLDHEVMGFEFVEPLVVRGLVDLTRDEFTTSLEDRRVIDFSVNDGTFAPPGKLWIVKILRNETENWTHFCRIVWPKDGAPNVAEMLLNERLPPVPLLASFMSDFPPLDAKDDKSNALSRRVAQSITTSEQSVPPTFRQSMDRDNGSSVSELSRTTSLNGSAEVPSLDPKAASSV
jgi:hypothetical protein